jgi:dipeptidase E
MLKYIQRIFMAVYLTGGGDQEEFSQLDRLFVEELKSGSKIGLLAQACDDALEALERIEYYFSDKKITSIELVTDVRIDLNQFDGLIIEGGNTFNLIKAVRESSLFNSLKNFYQSGKPIYADSAGAIILGSDVHTAFLGDDGDEDELKLQDYRGLDIIAPFCVHAHATSDELEDLNDLLYQIGSPILALAEECGIRIDKNEIKVFGSHELWVIDFEGRKSIAPQSSMEF